MVTLPLIFHKMSYMRPYIRDHNRFRVSPAKVEVFKRYQNWVWGFIFEYAFKQQIS